MTASTHSFFFHDPATTDIYTSFPTRRSSDLHGRAGPAARPDEAGRPRSTPQHVAGDDAAGQGAISIQQAHRGRRQDRKSTRLNSSHLGISYAVFCLKKKKKKRIKNTQTVTQT